MPLKIATTTDLEELYTEYVKLTDHPFFLDISGPSIQLGEHAFYDTCTDEAEIMVLRSKEGPLDNSIIGFILLNDIQEEQGVCNIDFRAIHNPSECYEQLKDLLQEIIKSGRFQRMQVMCLADERERIEFLVQSGFQLEGRLERQIFFNGAYHDLLILGMSLRHRKTLLAADPHA